MAPAARTLKAIQGFLTLAMYSTVSSGLMHHMLSSQPSAAVEPDVLLSEMLGRGREVVVLVERLSRRNHTGFPAPHRP